MGLIRMLGIVWYLIGLVLLWRADLIGWFVVGIIIPLIPCFYAVYHGLQHFGVL